MTFLESVKAKARARLKTIVFPEGDEKRTVQATVILKNERLADPVLIGEARSIRKTAEEVGADLSGITLLDPALSPRTSAYAAALYELRKAKGLTEEQAGRLVSDPMYFGMMAVKMNDADGLVSGAVHTTGDMLRPALQIIKTKPGISIVSSSFLMILPDRASSVTVWKAR